MKQASISLEKEVASAYLDAPSKERKKLDYIVNSWLKNIFQRKKNAKEKLFETMAAVGKEAQTNGLTPEILEQLLKEIKQDMKNEKH